MTARAADARACANIALVKYWGKRDAALNLPAAGSLSLTLAALVTETHVAFDPALPADELSLDGAPAPVARVSPFLDLVRARAGLATRARVVTAQPLPDRVRARVVGVGVRRARGRRHARGRARAVAARAVDPRAPRLGLGGALAVRRLRAHARRRHQRRRVRGTRRVAARGARAHGDRDRRRRRAEVARLARRDGALRRDLAAVRRVARAGPARPRRRRARARRRRPARARRARRGERARDARHRDRGAPGDRRTGSRPRSRCSPRSARCAPAASRHGRRWTPGPTSRSCATRRMPKPSPRPCARTRPT